MKSPPSAMGVITSCETTMHADVDSVARPGFFADSTGRERGDASPLLPSEFAQLPEASTMIRVGMCIDHVIETAAMVSENGDITLHSLLQRIDQHRPAASLAAQQIGLATSAIKVRKGASPLDLTGSGSSLPECCCCHTRGDSTEALRAEPAPRGRWLVLE